MTPQSTDRILTFFLNFRIVELNCRVKISELLMNLKIESQFVQLTAEIGGRCHYSHLSITAHAS